MNSLSISPITAHIGNLSCGDEICFAVSHKHPNTVIPSAVRCVVNQTADRLAIVDWQGELLHSSVAFRKAWCHHQAPDSLCELTPVGSWSSDILAALNTVRAGESATLSFQNSALFANSESPCDAQQFVFSPLLDDNGQTLAALIRWDEQCDLSSMHSQLALAHQRAADFASASSDWQWEMDSELRYTWFSDRLSEFYGLNPDDYIGKKRTELAKEKLDQHWLDHVAALEAHLPFQNFDYQLDLGDGEFRWCRINGVPYFDKDGEFLGYRGTGTDITNIKQIEREAEAANARFMRAMDHFPGAFLLIDPKKCCVVYNAKLLEMYRLSPSQLQPGEHISRFLYTVAGPYLETSSEEDKKTWVERRLNWINGSSDLSDVQLHGRWYRAASHRLPDESRLVTMLDITEHKETELAVANERLLLRSIIDAIPDKIHATDQAGRYTLMNAAELKQLGYNTFDEVLGQPAADDYNSEVARELIRADEEVLERGSAILDREHQTVDAEGRPRWMTCNKLPLHDPSGNTVGMVNWERDITDARQLAEQLRYQANHDTLTKLPNRLSFESFLNRRCSEIAEHGGSAVLGYLDLDQFKIVNDTAGHAAGDKLLQQVTLRIASALKNDEILARLGGDEFGLLFHRKSIEAAKQVSESIVELLEDYRFDWNGSVFSINASIGLVEINPKNCDPAIVLSQADMACYSAKDQGRGRACVYTQTDTTHTKRHTDLQAAAGITEAIEQDRLVLYAQPIAAVDPSGVSLSHVEILLRMQDKNGELVQPGGFIPAAERYGLMNRVDRWVIERTLDLIPSVLSEAQDVGVTINLSGQTLTDESLAARVHEQLYRSGVEPNRICFELTETAAISNLALADEFIGAMKKIGCNFALDDFGSGLSSFSYIKNFPVDYLKIDGAFVKDILTDPTDQVMVSAINQMGQVLGVKTIAEFVETEDIQKELIKIGVNYLQGYGVCRPMPFDENFFKACKYLTIQPKKAA